jgi:hypothetical protein
MAASSILEATTMDGERFDALVRSIDILVPRRAALRVLSGGLAALLGRFGIEDIEAKKGKKKKKKKKKCKKSQKKCGKKCIPKANCCSTADCGPEQSCVSGTCTCPEGFVPCGAECIDDSLCCADSDCFPIYTCEGGFCTCIDDPNDVPCNDVECCDPATEVCAVTGTTGSCQAGGCPAGADVCNDETFFFCGGPGNCVCTTSVEDEPVCTDFAGVCIDCTTDAECTTELGQDAVCIDLGANCTCDTGETTACVAVGCPSGFAAGRTKGGSSSPARRAMPKLGH